MAANETADSERAPLLASDGHRQQGGAGATSWRDALAQRWHHTTAAVSQWSQRQQRRQGDGADGHAGGGDDVDHAALRRRLARKSAWQRTAHIAGVGLFALVLGAILLGHVFLITMHPPTEDKQAAILARALAVQGPDRLSVLNLTADGIQVQLDARLGLDPDQALDEWLGVRGSRSPWQNLERRWLEWALRQVKGIRIDVVDSVVLAEPDWSKDLPNEHLHLLDGGKKKKRHSKSSSGSSIGVEDKQPEELLGFDIEPLYIRLPPLRSSRQRKSANSKDQQPDHPTDRAQTNITPLNLTLLLKPLVPIPHLVTFAESALDQGKATLDIRMPGLLVRGLGERALREGERRKKEGVEPVPRNALRSGWGLPGWISLRQGESYNRVTEHVPDIGPGNDTSKLLELTHYEFFEIGAPSQAPPAGGRAAGVAAIQDAVHNLAMRALGIRANAIAKNPLGKLLHGHVRYQLPFGVYLPIEDDDPEQPPVPPNSTFKAAKKPLHGDPDDESSVLMAVVASEPIELDGAKHLPLKIQGRVVPPPQAKAKAGSASTSTHAEDGAQVPFSTSQANQGVHVAETPQEKALSNFLSKFLRGDPNTVYVRGGSPWSRVSSSQGAALSSRKNDTKDGDEVILPGDGSPDLPEWIKSALSILDLPISFPGSKVTDLIKDVTISDLRFAAHPFEKERILCSGTVMGVLNLPKELGGVDVKVTQLWPDILVFDGKPPSMRKPHRGHGGDGGSGGDHDDDDDDYYDDGGKGDNEANRSQRPRHRATHRQDEPPSKPTPSPEPIPPLPDPIPERAFGRLRPHDFTPATTVPDPSDPTGARKLLRAELLNVPFTVLPGRQAEFRAFAWKILTGGATAGIEGTARARIWNSGLGVLELSQLPVKGTFPVNPPSAAAAAEAARKAASMLAKGVKAVLDV